MSEINAPPAEASAPLDKTVPSGFTMPTTPQEDPNLSVSAVTSYVPPPTVSTQDIPTGKDVPVDNLPPGYLQAAVGPKPGATMDVSQLPPGYLDHSTDSDTVSPLKDWSVDQIVKTAEANPKDFDPLSMYESTPFFDKTADMQQKMADVFMQLWDKGQYRPSLGTIVKNGLNVPVSFAKRLYYQAQSLQAAPLLAAQAISGQPLDPATIAGQLAIQSKRVSAETTAGTETGLAQIPKMLSDAGSAVSRLFGTSTPLSDYTPQEKLDALNMELAWRAQLAKLGSGGEVGQTLAEQGSPVRPEQVGMYAQTDPASWWLMGKGFEAAAPLAKGAAAVALGTTPEQIAQTFAGPAKTAGNLSAQALGKVVSSTGTALEKVSGLVERTAKPAGGAIGGISGVLAGSHLAGPAGVIFGGMEGVEKGLKAGEKVASLADKAQGAAQSLKAAGQQIAGQLPATSRIGQFGQDVSQALPQAATQIGLGAAFDLATQTATAKTPAEREQLTPFGTMFGVLGAGEMIGQRALSGQIVMPGNEWGTKIMVPSTKNFPTLAQLHDAAFNAAVPGVKGRINALRSFNAGVNPTGEVFVIPHTEPGTPDQLPAALQPLGLPPDWADQGGATPQATLIGADGQPHFITIVRDVDSGPHEVAGHLMDNVVGAAKVQELNTAAKQEYGPIWDAFAQHYASQLLNSAVAGADGNRTEVLQRYGLGDNPTASAIILALSGKGNAYAQEKIFNQSAQQLSESSGGIPTDAQIRDTASPVIQSHLDSAQQSGIPLWQQDLTPEEQQFVHDQYIGNEVRAENSDAWFKSGQDPKTFGGKMWLAAAKMAQFLGVNPVEGRASQHQGLPLSFGQMQQAGETAQGLVQPSASTVKLPKVIAIPGSPAAKAQQDKRDAAIVNSAPDVPLPGAAKSQREMAGVLNEAKNANGTVAIEYGHAGGYAPAAGAGEPSEAILTAVPRSQRRAFIEAWRNLPIETRTFTEKLFSPESFNVTKQGKQQVYGGVHAVLAANAQKMATFALDHPETLPQGMTVDPKTKSFNPESWNYFLDSVQKYSHNQLTGRTGAGKELMVPKMKGYYAPPVTGEAQPIRQDMADFINAMYGTHTPTTARIAKEDIIPLNLAGQRVSEATQPGRVAAPTSESPEFGEGTEKSQQVANKLGISGQHVLEPNPFLARLNSYTDAPSFIEARQKLNLEHMADVNIAPAGSPTLRGNTLTLAAGFQPKEAFTPSPALSDTGKDMENRGYMFGHRSNENIMHGVTIRDPQGHIIGHAQGSSFKTPDNAAISSVVSEDPYIREVLRLELNAYLRSRGYKTVQDFSPSPVSAPASDEQMAEYERQRAAYERTPWWKQPPPEETETTRHSSALGDEESGVILHSAKQRSTVFLNPGTGAKEFLNKLNSAPTQADKDALIESYFSSQGGQFQSKKPIELEGPDGTKYPATLDGYQDFRMLGKGIMPQITPLVDLPGAAPARSTTYGETLQKAGYKWTGVPEPTEADIAGQFLPRPVEEIKRALAQAADVTKDRNGNPKPFFHGTTQSEKLVASKQFNPNRANPTSLYGPGFYFTDDPATAGGTGNPKDAFGYAITSGGGATPGVVPAFLDVRHPLNIDKTYSPNVLYSLGDKALGATLAKPAINSELESALRKEFDATHILSREDMDFATDNNFPIFSIAKKAGWNPERDGKLSKFVKPYLDWLNSDQQRKFYIAGDALGKAVSGQEIYDALARVAASEFSTELDSSVKQGASGPFSSVGAQVRRFLEEAGFDGIAHTGGNITGNKPHQVVVAFHPEQIYGAYGGTARKTENPANFQPKKSNLKIDKENVLVGKTNDDLSIAYKSVPKADADKEPNLHRSVFYPNTDPYGTWRYANGALIWWQEPDADQAWATRAHLESRGYKITSERVLGRMDMTAAGFQNIYDRAHGMFQPRKTFIVRHGSTEMNNTDPEKDLIRGHIDVPLDAKGKKEAETISDTIAHNGGVQRIITSDLTRTKQTAQAISDKTGAPIEIDPGLRPWKLGPTIEGHPTAQMLPVIKKYIETPDERPPEGESLNEFKDRFLGAFHRAQDAYPDKDTAIITHYRGTKLLDAWRAAGTDNDNIDTKLFGQYDKNKKPGHVEILDKTGAQFVPRKVNPTQDYKFFNKKLAPSAQFSPSQQPLFDDISAKEPLSSKKISDMSVSEIRDHYPEAVVPNRVRNTKGELVDPGIPSDIKHAPLVHGLSESEAVNKFAGKLVEETHKWQGDPAFDAGKKWYSDFVPKLKSDYGKYHHLMAELLAATSPNNTPQINFAMANDALEMYKMGRYDSQIKKYLVGLKKIGDGSWKRWFKLNGTGIPTAAAFLDQWSAKYNLQPRQSNGKLFSMHSDAVLQVLARKWLNNSQGLKTLNFIKNLLGTGSGATIDLWADRTMRRLGYEGFKDRWRILPNNATSVSDADFVFSQKAFAEAAQRVNMSPAELQGALWFAEKKHWANNGWGRLDLGSFTKELSKVPLLNAGIKNRLANSTMRVTLPARTTPELVGLVEQRPMR